MPTYSAIEVLDMIKDLSNDKEALIELGRLVTEEKFEYCLRDLLVIEFYYRMLQKVV